MLWGRSCSGGVGWVMPWWYRVGHAGVGGGVGREWVVSCGVGWGGSGREVSGWGGSC